MRSRARGAKPTRCERAPPGRRRPGEPAPDRPNACGGRAALALRRGGHGRSRAPRSLRLPRRVAASGRRSRTRPGGAPAAVRTAPTSGRRAGARHDTRRRRSVAPRARCNHIPLHRRTSSARPTSGAPSSSTRPRRHSPIPPSTASSSGSGSFVAEQLPCGRYLDAGCGDGRYLAALTELPARPKRVAATDISERILEVARAAASAAGIELEAIPTTWRRCRSPTTASTSFSARR